MFVVASLTMIDKPSSVLQSRFRRYAFLSFSTFIESPWITANNGLYRYRQPIGMGVAFILPVQPLMFG